MSDFSKLIKKWRADTNAVDNGQLPRHRWYPIKEGFSANFVSSSLSEWNDESTMPNLCVEPFSGSGTSVVECARKGVECHAYEVNPFLAFVGKTKLLDAKRETFERNQKIVVKGLRRPKKSRLEGISTFTEGDGRSKWLFNLDVLRSFTAGWEAVRQCSPNTRNLSRLALIRAAMDNCNAYPDGKCLRYKRLPNYKCFSRETFEERFDFYSQMIAEDLESSPLQKHRGIVECMDSRGLRREDQKFDVCITSPPYLNSFDYSDVYRPEMFLGEFVKDNSDLMAIRLKTLRSHIQANWEKPTSCSFGAVYAKAIIEINDRRDQLWSNKIPLMIQAYFEDMEKLIRTLSERANPNALLKIAVATSAYAGVVIPVDFILAEIAESLGWSLKEVLVVRRLRSSGQHWKHESHKNDVPELRESIVILRWPQ